MYTRHGVAANKALASSHVSSPTWPHLSCFDSAMYSSVIYGSLIIQQ